MTIVIGLALVGVVAVLFHTLRPRGMSHLDDAVPAIARRPFRIP